MALGALALAKQKAIVSKLSAIEQPRAGRGADVPELRARHEQRGERQRFEPDRSGKPEAWIEIRARDIHLRELRRQLSFCASHIRTTAKRVGRKAECGLDRCLGDRSRRGEFCIQLCRRPSEQDRNRVDGLPNLTFERCDLRARALYVGECLLDVQVRGQPGLRAELCELERLLLQLHIRSRNLQTSLQ